jgi:protein-ribulosamine 3-kinase
MFQEIINTTISNTKVLSAKPIGGGCINEAYKVETTKGWFFLKTNIAEKYPGMFETEAKGLDLLREKSAFKIPEVITTGIHDHNAFLLLEFIAEGEKNRDASSILGTTLAKMHRVTNQTFGLDYDNYIGSLKQSNKAHFTWPDFFINERIEPQIEIAYSKNLMNKAIRQKFEKFFQVINEIFPSEKPALLHGDLWSGNYFFSSSSQAVLFDPAIYFGHREQDLAMTKLFGGFDSDFYASYHAEFPLQNGFEKRIGYFNLYPLLVHVNLFGAGYLRSIEEILKPF